MLKKCEHRGCIHWIQNQVLFMTWLYLHLSNILQNLLGNRDYFFTVMVTIQGKPKLNLDYKWLDQRWVKYKKITPRVQLCSNSFCIFLVLWDDSDEFFMPVLIWWMLAHGDSQMNLVGDRTGVFLVPQCCRLPAGAAQRRCQAVLWSSLLGMLIHPSWLAVTSSTGLGDTAQLLSSKPGCFFLYLTKLNTNF